MNVFRSTGRRHMRESARRGLTILIVLTLLSITMALSYAMLRTQANAVQIQNNSNRGLAAKQAAAAGMAAALRQMGQSTWAGVGTTLVGTINSTDSFSVTYTSGDPSLTPTSSNYSDLPWRVTLLSTGTSRDAAHSTVTSSYRLQTVVRLVPANLNTEPTGWTGMQAYSVYQLNNSPFKIDPPCQLQGPLRVQGKMTIGNEYSWNPGNQSMYLSGLNAMRSNGYSDYRPVTGPVSLPSGGGNASAISTLNSDLQVTTNTISVTSAPTMQSTNAFATYRLYPGGKIYNAVILGSSLQNTTLAPDPATNPAGLFYCQSSLTLQSNVTIQGTLIVQSDLHIAGTGVTLNSFSLPALVGTTTPVQLPAAVVQNNFCVDSTGGGVVNGVVVAGNQFMISAGSQWNVFDVNGTVICGEFDLLNRTEWNWGASTWNFVAALFGGQQSSKNGVLYFPVWCAVWGLTCVPTLTVGPSATGVTPHWQDPTLPFYQPDSAHPGLRWDLQSWTDLH